MRTIELRVRSQRPQFGVGAVEHFIRQIHVFGDGRVLGVDVPQVPRQDHRFVIAQDKVHLPPDGGGFALHAANGIEGFGNGVAAVHDVAVEQQVPGAPCPVAVGIHNTVGLQEAHHGVVVAFDVADGQQAFGHGPRGQRHCRWLGVHEYGDARVTWIRQQLCHFNTVQHAVRFAIAIRQDLHRVATLPDDVGAVA